MGNLNLYYYREDLGVGSKIAILENYDPSSSCSNRYLCGTPQAPYDQSSQCSFVWVPETDSGFTNEYAGFNYILYFESQYQNENDTSSAISVVDDLITGCTDPCATSNYNSDATVDNGSCEYSACTVSGAENYFCNECGEALPCNESGEHSYTFGDITDDNSCTFSPVADIVITPDSLTEGNTATVSGVSSVSQNADGNSYGYDGCDLEYSWTVSDNEGLGDYETFNTSDISSFTFTLPTFVGTDQGGGGILYVSLTVTNADGHTNTYNWNSGLGIAVGDIDIIGTQLSTFPSIYIPGDNEISYIGCYLPPTEDGTYILQYALDASFFNVSTNPDNTDEGSLIPGEFLTGDTSTCTLCLDEDCEGDTKINSVYNYITDYGWYNPLGDFPLVPGMGIRLMTTNAGWLRWTIVDGIVLPWDTE